MPCEYRTRRQIEFSDTDMAGIVHFSRFFVFMETTEHEFLRSLGTSATTKWQGHTIGWPRLSATCQYVQPVKFEDKLDIHLRIVKKGRTTMMYQFDFRKDFVDIARGEMQTVCCICGPDMTLKPIPIPGDIAAKLDNTQVANERSCND